MELNDKLKEYNCLEVSSNSKGARNDKRKELCKMNSEKLN